MTKVVYNACHGGFGLSNEALDRMVELGYPMELNPDWNPNSDSIINFKYKTYVRSISRHDPILVQVVEELEERANGSYSNLRIEEVNGPYRIDEYDGLESVETPNSYDWIVP